MTHNLQLPGIILHTELGSGGFGCVYKATLWPYQTPVAVKVLTTTEADARERFRREVRILEDLADERFVVDLIFANLEHHPPHYAMEYCSSGSLATLLMGQGRFSPKAVAGALAQASRGLAAIHRNGGFHRDLKPANMLLSRDDARGVAVKLADFGLARTPHPASGTITRGGAGTPGYISPQVSAGKEFQGADDIYSLGISGIEMLTGSRDPSEIKTAKAPGGLKQLLWSMIDPDDRQRPSALEVHRASLAVIRRAKVQPARLPTNPPASPPAVTGNGGDVFAGLLVGALVAALGVALVANLKD